MLRHIFAFSFGLVTLLSCAQSKSRKDFLVHIITPQDTMLAILYDDTPTHKANFIKLAQQGYYDSTTFHRVIQNFMIQGGDPNSKNDNPNDDGIGGPGYTLEAEFIPYHFHKKGALSAARLGDNQNPEKRSSGSQFYIVQGKKIDTTELNRMVLQKQFSQHNLLFDSYISLPENKHIKDSLQALRNRHDRNGFEELIKSLDPIIDRIGAKDKFQFSEEQLKVYSSSGGTPHLDGEYTVFGEVIKGLDAIDKIATVDVHRHNSRPKKDIPMCIFVEELSKREITKRTGYQYRK